MPLGVPLSPQFMADSLALERRYLDEIRAVPRDRLGEEDSRTYDIFKRQRELDVAGFTYPTELLPVNPFDARPLQFARAAAGWGQHPFASAKDYENWLLAIDDYARWTHQAIANMREGMRRGYTSPRILMERTLPLLQALGEDSSASVFYIPLRTMPEGIDAAERTRLTASLTRAIKEKLLPAYRELHDFIQSDYLPRARRSVALSDLPLGASWYAALVRRATGDQLAPSEIHSIGAAEVERIGARIVSSPAGPPVAGTPLAGKPLAGTPPFAGTHSLAGTPSPAGTPALAGTVPLATAYLDLKTQVLAAMPSLFSAVPPADFEIREFAPSLFAGAPLIYPPVIYRPATPDGRTPAVLYVADAPGGGRAGAADAVSFLQEALPGRHYQSALQQQRADLPKFRRFGSEPAFVDGWALYAASLGEEMGVYRDDDTKRQADLGQLRCAAALVVDTGLHAMGWTRAQALDYLRAHLALDDAEAGLMADRFVALPGQALACKMGELKIRALRARAQQQLGARFDIREFHSEILKDGAMPLDILDAKIKLWMDARR